MEAKHFVALSLLSVLIQATPALAQAGRANVDTRIVAAAERGDWTVVQALVSRENVNARGTDGSTALLWATYRSSLPTVKALLASGADVNIANRYGVAPLLQASRLGDSALVTLLVQSGADIRGEHPQGETPLMAAAGAGSVDAVKLLLARGADVNVRETVDQQSALMWAANAGHLEVVRTLLRAGANPNFAARSSALSRARMGDSGRMWVDHPSGGLTALMFAARQGHVDVVRALVEGGADVSYQNPDKLSAMMVAVVNDRIDVAALLLEQGASVEDGTLYEAVQTHNLRTNETTGEATRPRIPRANTITPIQFIERLLQKGADPNRVTTHILHIEGILAGNTGSSEGPSETPFARAVRAQDVAAIRLMIAHGAKPDGMLGPQLPLTLAMGIGAGRGFAGGFGVQPGPYRHASERGIPNAVAVLLAAGADVNATTPAGDTPLHGAAQTGNLAVIKQLVEKGARLDAKNKAGFTPLDVAMGRGAPAGGRGGGGGGGGRGGPPPVQEEAAALLKELMAGRGVP